MYSLRGTGKGKGKGRGKKGGKGGWELEPRLRFGFCASSSTPAMKRERKKGRKNEMGERPNVYYHLHISKAQLYSFDLDLNLDHDHLMDGRTKYLSVLGTGLDRSSLADKRVQ